MLTTAESQVTSEKSQRGTGGTKKVRVRSAHLTVFAYASSRFVRIATEARGRGRVHQRHHGSYQQYGKSTEETIEKVARHRRQARSQILQVRRSPSSPPSPSLPCVGSERPPHAVKAITKPARASNARRSPAIVSAPVGSLPTTMKAHPTTTSNRPRTNSTFFPAMTTTNRHENPRRRNP